MTSAKKPSTIELKADPIVEIPALAAIAQPAGPPLVPEKMEVQVPLAAPVEAASAPAGPTPAQQAAIDKVVADSSAEAKRKIESILLAHPSETLGTPSGDIEDRTEATQRDYLSGTRRKDKTYVPEKVYDSKRGITRKALLHGEYKYMLVDGDSIEHYSYSLGYKMCRFDGGNQSGLAPYGFDGTDSTVFKRDLAGHCQRGDCFLMWIPIRGWNELAEDDRAEIDKAMPKALGSFANAAYSVGIRPFVEAEGKSLT